MNKENMKERTKTQKKKKEKKRRKEKWTPRIAAELLNVHQDKLEMRQAQ